MSTSTGRTLRGRGPGTYARIAEIKSGRSHSQQGLTATCEDWLTKAKAIGRQRDWDWRMGS